MFYSCCCCCYCIIMKALGKCLICRREIAKEEIPPEHAKIYQTITEILIKHLSGKELAEISPLFPLQFLSAVFPFCNRNQCRNIVTTLYQNDLQIQTRVRRIQQIIGKSQALRSRCHARKNKIRSFAKTKDVSSEFSETSGHESETSSVHMQDTATDCKSIVKRSSRRNSRPTFLKKKQQNDSLLLKPGVKPVTTREALMQTGPETFVYLGKFGIEWAQDGYRCSTCGYIRRSRAYVMGHIRMVHAPPLPHRRNIRLTEKSPNMWYYAEFAAEKVGDEYRCLSCTHVSKLRKNLTAHLRYQHYVAAHPEEAAPNSFVCEVCGKILTSGFRLKMHKESHADKPTYTCKDCGDSFNTWDKLKLHRRKHLGEEGKKFVCEHCGRKFWVQSELKNHLFRHTGKREFVCKVCGKSYATSVGLSRHLDSHTGRKYVCDLCEMEFTQSDSVIRHKKTAHGVHIAPSKQRQKETRKKV